MTRRVLSIWLPMLPLDRLVRKGDPRLEGAFAVIASIRNMWRLTHVSLAARHAGVAAGLTLADARAICPDLLTEPADLQREAALLHALRRWSDRFSPRTALDDPDGLLLDITGCAHLFGGEISMAEEACNRLRDMQITARAGIADTRNAAWALARFSAAPLAVAAPGQTREALAPLPLAALGIPSGQVDELGSVGLKTIGQLYRIRSAELARRFGLDVVRVLDEALGHIPNPVPFAARLTTYTARMALPEPIGFVADLEAVLQRLADSVCRRLGKDHKGGRHFHLTVRGVEIGNQVLTARFAQPCADAAALLRQFAPPLEQLRLEFGADWFRLVAEAVEPVRPRQTVFGEENCPPSDTGPVITTLGNRLGFDRILRFVPRDSHLPEREFTTVEAAGRQSGLAWTRSPRHRPLRLYRPPERLHLLEPARPPGRFEWRLTVYRTSLAKGPERLIPEWWRGGDTRLRDYWTVQTVEGLRLWLLTYPGTEQPDWYVAGRFP